MFGGSITAFVVSADESEGGGGRISAVSVIPSDVCAIDASCGGKVEIETFC